MTETIIRLQGVTRQFSASDAPALDSVDLEIERGEFVAIIGQSGAGKSTLLNVLGLLDGADEGSYSVNAVETRDLSESQRDRLRAETFGFVFQDSFVLPTETVARNVALPLRINGVDLEQQRTSVAEALGSFGLLDKTDQTAATLSGGERQRVAFARAVVNRPLVLLADEPTGNLDSANTERVLTYLRELHAQGVTIVVITHSQHVADVAQRRVEVTDGRITYDSRVESNGSTESDGRRIDKSSTLDPVPIASEVGPGRGWHLAEALSALLLSPLRSLTILAAFIVAIGGLVTAVNMTATAANQVSSTLSAAALDEVVVRMSSQEELTGAAERIREIEGVESVATVVQMAANDARVTRPTGDSSVVASADARAVDGEYLRLQGITVWPAHAPELLAAADGTPAVVLGPDLASKLGLEVDRVGEVVTVGGQRSVVVGYIRSAERDATLSNVALVSSADFVPPEGSTFGLVVRTSPGLPAKVAEAIPLSVSPGHPEGVQVQTVADLRELTKGVNSDLAVNVLLISAVLLVLVCLTSSISMFLTVTARTREIALRRAVGATRNDILSLFLLEGVVLGCAGGVAGAALGIAATSVMSLVLRWSPTFDPIGALIAIGAGALAGAVSAIVPARRAARIHPAIALRSG